MSSARSTRPARRNRHQPSRGHARRRLLGVDHRQPQQPGGVGVSNTLMTDASIYARRNLEHIRQVPEKLTNVTVQPLMFVVLFAYVFGGAIQVGGAGYKEYLIG